MEFVGPAIRLQPDDIMFAARGLGVETAALRAVIDVETSGSGFDKLNRPSMLFEPHIFYRLLDLPGLDPRVLDRAIAAGVAYPHWTPGHYPLDSYPRLTIATSLNEDAALQSASWGLGQIMGSNFGSLGYSTVEQMVSDAVLGEATQLAQMCRFIKVNNLTVPLKALDWPTFARRYNGPGQVDVYATKLAVAYAAAAGSV